MMRVGRLRRSDPSHPIVFLFLNLPFGVMSGYVTVTLGYLLSQGGVGTDQVAELIAVSVIPHTWKFLWAPIVDTTLSRKAWYVLTAMVSAVGIFAIGVPPANASSLRLLKWVVLVANVAL